MVCHVVPGVVVNGDFGADCYLPFRGLLASKFMAKETFLV